MYVLQKLTQWFSRLTFSQEKGLPICPAICKTLLRMPCSFSYSLFHSRRNCKRCQGNRGSYECGTAHCCGSGKFQCLKSWPRVKCIDNDKRCNSNNDCGKWEDEEGCSISSSKVALSGKYNQHSMRSYSKMQELVN